MRLMHLLSLSALVLLLGCPRTGGGDDDDDDSAGSTSNLVVMETTMGTVEIEVYVDESPITAENFLAYVDSGFYDGRDDLGATVFHRVVTDFVVQGGGFTAGGAMKDTAAAIENEAIVSGLSNTRGTLSMARLSAPDTATSQFFVNLVDNLFLDPQGSTPDGYAVFAEVTTGMDVIDAMGAVSVDGSDAPLTAVVINSMQRQ